MVHRSARSRRERDPDVVKVLSERGHSTIGEIVAALQRFKQTKWEALGPTTSA